METAEDLDRVMKRRDGGVDVQVPSERRSYLEETWPDTIEAARDAMTPKRDPDDTGCRGGEKGAPSRHSIGPSPREGQVQTPGGSQEDPKAVRGPKKTTTGAGSGR